MEDPERVRWARRPGWARTVRVAVFVAPVAASFGAALAVRTMLPTPDGMLARAGVLGVLVVVSTLVLLVVDRLGRRALPLVTLLDLSMLFPDRAPSRLGVARDAIRRRPIEEQLRRVQEAGADPGTAAREILALVAALSAHDRPTRGHAERVRMFTDLLAEQMRVPARDRDLLRWASILHDIGKLRVPASLLNKPAKPSEEEWLLLKAHPSHGAEMAAALLPWLGEWGAVIVEHHERYDGTGYPHGLSGREISLGARIVSVADAYDVMTAARAYKRPVSRAAACRELVRYSGTQFDPVVVRAMVAVGAPRLRRAQGVLSWIANIPLVASGAVPAATVARVVGAGALATGAVTGGIALGGSVDTTPRTESAVTVSDSGAATRQGRDGDRRATGAASTVPQTATGTPGAELAPSAEQSSAHEGPGWTGTPSSSGPVDSDGSGPDPSDRASTGSGTGTGPSVTGGSSGSAGSGGSSPSPTSSPTTGPVAGTVDSLTDTVDTVIGTVGGAVEDPVGTVDDVVSDPVGTVTGTVGSLLGSNPSPSPSPTSSGGGLLGGLLGG